ncbi:MAG TPA: hypothetical protein VGM82_24580 [Gemmatimonadaceae bacterium]|jgi:hypothetical protein
MSLIRSVLPIAFVAGAFITACSDARNPAQPQSAPAAALAAKGGLGGGGGAGGGGGNGGGGNGNQLVVTTPPTANISGTWVGTTDGPDVVHNYTYTLSQTGAGIVSGTGLITTPFTTVTELVAGTVNGDTLMLYSGVVCGSCTLNPLYRGIISSGASQVNGSFIIGGVSPLTLSKR